MRHTSKATAAQRSDRPLKGSGGSKAMIRKSAIPIPKVPWKPTHATLSEIRHAVRDTIRGRRAVDA
jgi:hypothetical protein